MRVIPIVLLLVTLTLFEVFGTAAKASNFLPDKGSPFPSLSEEDIRQKTNDGLVRIGDMLFEARRLKERTALRRLWPHGRIYYQFSPEVTSGQKSNFELACQTWTVSTPLSCIKRTNEPNYLLVRTNSSNGQCALGASCSHVGMKGGVQDLWMTADGWNYLSVIQHEIGHAIGLIHEHQRQDRDQYIMVNQGNLEPGWEQDIILKDAGRSYSEYDYASVMHYDNCMGSKLNGCTDSTPSLWTLQARSCHQDLVGGWQIGISPLDRDGVRNAYAPALQGILRRERDQSCGRLDYHPEILAKVCNECALSTVTQYRKVDYLKRKWCGSIPVVYPETFCRPVGKEYITHTWDKDEFSCGRLNGETEHELVVHCGCPYQTVAAECTNLSAFTSDALKDPYRAKRHGWTATRVLYFQNVIEDLKGSEGVADAVVSSLGEFYQINFLDPKFETKLARARAAIFSYVRWRRSITPAYELDWPTFVKIIKNNRLRVPQPRPLML